MFTPCVPGRPMGSMKLPMKKLDDAEGPRLPTGFPQVVDAHVHIFPDRVLDALYRWFEKNAWEIRYPLRSGQISQFLFERGLSRVVALHYAHAPGMARGLNRFMAEVCRNEPRIIGLATVLPGEPDAKAIVEEAFALGLSGVKLHCHVQCFSPDAPEMHEIYSACESADLPMVLHAGREPALPQYNCDPYQLCAVERVARALDDHPRLRLCVAHLGADEETGYAKLLERYDHLWLDTTMTLGGFLPLPFPGKLVKARPDRILYGSDFPILPYAWDRELRAFEKIGLTEEERADVLGRNALSLFEKPGARP